jgi:N-acetyl-1-D-myo-inositol-2-amino-2-deoxy-alpha-D-glucopyranoside deacetylase
VTAGQPGNTPENTEPRAVAAPAVDSAGSNSQRPAGELAGSEILRGRGGVLFVHAHPDDETIATGALIAELSTNGRAVWLVTATRGERGEVVPGPLSALEGTEELAAERERELDRATTILGVTQRFWLGESPVLGSGAGRSRHLDAFDGSAEPAPIEFVGAELVQAELVQAELVQAEPVQAESRRRVYRDSGMEWVRPGLAGPASDVEDSALVNAPLDEPTADLVAIISLLQPDLVVSYNSGGGYGHPDHVHIREAALAASRSTGTRFAEIEARPGELVEWFDLRNQLATVTAALRSYATQLTVDGAELVHSGGQREPIATAMGLRLVS